MLQIIKGRMQRARVRPWSTWCPISTFVLCKFCNWKALPYAFKVGSYLALGNLKSRKRLSQEMLEIEPPLCRWDKRLYSTAFGRTFRAKKEGWLTRSFRNTRKGVLAVAEGNWCIEPTKKLFDWRLRERSVVLFNIKVSNDLPFLSSALTKIVVTFPNKHRMPSPSFCAMVCTRCDTKFHTHVHMNDTNNTALTCFVVYITSGVEIIRHAGKWQTTRNMKSRIPPRSAKRKWDSAALFVSLMCTCV